MFGIVQLLLDNRGNAVTVFALAVPALAGLVALTVDYASMTGQQKRLQAAADIAALAAVQEAPIHRWSTTKVSEIAKGYVRNNLGPDETVASTVTVDRTTQRVTVSLRQTGKQYFVLGSTGEKPEVGATATATLFGNTNLCLLGMSASAAQTIFLHGQAAIAASDCGAFSNSSASKGMAVVGKSMLSASLICSSGGYTGTAMNYQPAPTMDCPPVPDPLGFRNIQATGPCVDNGISREGGNVSIRAGTHCGPVILTKEARVVLERGIHTFKGMLIAQSGTKIVGEGVTLQFVGSSAGFRFENSVGLSLTAPVAGDTAGLLIHGETHSDDTRQFAILSRNAERVVGAIYLPNSPLLIGGDADMNGLCDAELALGRGGDDDDDDDDDGGGRSEPGRGAGGPPDCVVNVGQASEWTAIVAKRVIATLGANIRLNSDYAASRIPPPETIVGRKAGLVR